MFDVEAVVVGAGVVGLAIARALCKRGVETMVLERNATIGSETSARNSEVIHAGIYYPQNSLKAQLCVRGKQLMYRFCKENNVDILPCGKLLLATSEQEVPALHKLKDNGFKNGVDDLVLLNSHQAQQLEPDVHCVMACLSPSTGVVNSHEFMQALEGHIQSAGGEVILNTAVCTIDQFAEGFNVFCGEADDGYPISCRYLINSSGHGAQRLAETVAYNASYQPPRIYPAIGHYYRLNQSLNINHLLYPMPDGAWLGTHLTLDTNGQAKFGPDCEWIDSIDYTFDDSIERKQRFLQEIRRYLPSLQDESLQADYTGIRPKIYPQGQPAPDFAIQDSTVHGIKNMISLFGIESPGLTSSLAIGNYTCELLGITGKEL